MSDRSAAAVTVAIDGPAGAGKSTVAKRAARDLGFTLVDTGAIYRAVALSASRQGVPFDDDARLAAIVNALEISFRLVGDTNHVEVGGEDVTEAIRLPEMSMGASTVSARKVVRDGLLDLQRRLAGASDAVLEGRDIGTVVCPDAQVKIYLDASPEERARRRHGQLREQGGEIPSFAAVLADVQRRDAQDMGREHAPLKAAADAIIVDSTRMNADDVVATIVSAVHALRG